MSEFVTLGELLIDFTPAGEKNAQRLYMRNAGGAVANVAAALAGFRVSAAFLGMVGNDAFGRYLERVLRDKGVDTKGLVFSDQYNTTLAFVDIGADGERDFTFYRKPGADTMYDKSLINFDVFKDARVFHFGSLSLTNEPARSATYEAAKFAKSRGTVVSYDPNYRAPLWESERSAKEQILKGLEYADILKISDSEAFLLFGDMPHGEAAEKLLKKGVKLVFITLGSRGALYANASCMGTVKAFAANAVDTTGAGDCFTAAALYGLLKCGKAPDKIAAGELREITRFACAAASVCVESPGGIPSMPSLGQAIKRLGREPGFYAPAVDNDILNN